MQNKIEFFVFKLFIVLGQLLGIEKSKILVKILLPIFYYLIPIRKKTAFKNLQISFPEKSMIEINRIVYENYRSFLITLFEIFNFPKLLKETIENFVEFENIEQIKRECNKNKGAIFLTAHFGNWEIGALSMALKLKTKIYVLAKDQRNSYVTEWFTKMREKFGNEVVKLGTGVKNIYAALKKNGLVGIVGDQRGPKEGKRYKIFNKDTVFYNGAAIIGAKLNIPIILILVVRNSAGKYKGLTKILKVNESASNEEKTDFIMTEYISFLEKVVTEYPEQWFWFHNIWKY